MKASITESTVTLTLEMTRADLQMLFEGVGNTSIKSRKDAGMSNEQSALYSEFYYALELAIGEMK